MFGEKDANLIKIAPLEVTDDDQGVKKLQVEKLTSETTDVSYWPVLFRLKKDFLVNVSLFHVFENGKSALLITGDDRVYVFGRELKLFPQYPLNLYEPTEIESLSGQEVSSVCESDYCIVILCRDGTLFGWPATPVVRSLQPEPWLRGIVKVKSFDKFIFALDLNGKLWFCCNNSQIQLYKRCKFEVVDFDITSRCLVVATRTNCIVVYQRFKERFVEEQFNETIKLVASLGNVNLVLTHSGDLYQNMSERWKKCELISPVELLVSYQHQIYLRCVDGSYYSYDPSNWSQRIRISPTTFSDAHYFYHPMCGTPMLTALPAVSNQCDGKANRLNDPTSSDLKLVMYHSSIENVIHYKSLHVHRSIICQRDSMLSSRLKNGAHKLFLDHYRFPVYYHYIKYLYSGHLDVAREWLFEFDLMVSDGLEKSGEEVSQQVKSLQKALSLEDLVELYRVSVSDNHLSDRHCHQVKVQQNLEEAIMSRISLKDIDALHRQLYFTPIAGRLATYFTENYYPIVRPLPRWQPESDSNATQDITYWPVLFYLKPTFLPSVSHFYVFKSTRTALVVTYQRRTYLVNEKQMVEIPELRHQQVSKIIETYDYFMVLLEDCSLFVWEQVDTNKVFDELNLLLSLQEVRDMVADWQCVAVVNTSGRVLYWSDLNRDGEEMKTIAHHQVVALECSHNHFFAITAQSLILIWDFGLEHPENIIVMRFEGVHALAPNIAASRCFALGSCGEMVRFKYDTTFYSVTDLKHIMLRENAQSLVACDHQMYVKMFSGSIYLVFGNNARKLVATSNRCAADAHYFWGDHGHTPQITFLSPELTNPLRLYHFSNFNNSTTSDFIIYIHKPQRKHFKDRFKQPKVSIGVIRKIFAHEAVLKQCIHYQKMLQSIHQVRHLYADRMYRFGTHFAYLRYLYTRVVEVSIEFFPELYEMAREYSNFELEHELDEYGMQFTMDQWLAMYAFYSHKWYFQGENIRQVIHRFLTPKVTKENCLHVFERLFKVACVDLKKWLYPLIYQHWSALSRSKELTAMRDAIRQNLIYQMENFPAYYDSSSDEL